MNSPDGAQGRMGHADRAGKLPRKRLYISKTQDNNPDLREPKWRSVRARLISHF